MVEMKKNRHIFPRLLLHVCCATCSMYPYLTLSREYDVYLYFYNPNIQPRKEYLKRLSDVKKVSSLYNIPLIEDAYNLKEWFDLARPYKDEPEGGKRCCLCFNMRLQKTADTAKVMGFRYFATTLTVSPHKNPDIINKIGDGISQGTELIYYDSDFKKRDGFKKSMQISKQLSFYRQNYCGCMYSIRKR